MGTVREDYSPHGSADSAVGGKSGMDQAIVLIAPMRNPMGRHAVSWLEYRGTACSHSDCFDHLHVFSGEGELFSLEILFHMLWVRRAGQREHPHLHRKPKDDLRETSS